MILQLFQWSYSVLFKKTKQKTEEAKSNLFPASYARIHLKIQNKTKQKRKKNKKTKKQNKTKKQASMPTKTHTAYSFLPDLSIFICCWVWSQIFSSLLTYIFLISFPVSYVMLIISAVLYLPFKPWFLILFLFYQTHVNFLRLSSMLLSLLFSSKILRAKSYTFAPQH